ncbi:hypothetical protein [Actinomadura hibisca]|uniref:hypothetical protein n=1 Tax=Actinomadura hibisca TaxID=68565 RepID=UPI000831DB08|nr:hypothetical protein [Actinomadura hibisca]
MTDREERSADDLSATVPAAEEEYSRQEDEPGGTDVPGVDVGQQDAFPAEDDDPAEGKARVKRAGPLTEDDPNA